MIAGAGLALRPVSKRGKGRQLSVLAGSLRRLVIPVIGRIAEDALILDLRCLEDEQGFAANLGTLDVAGGGE